MPDAVGDPALGVNLPFGPLCLGVPVLGAAAGGGGVPGAAGGGVPGAADAGSSMPAFLAK